jgi:hypothetical protein
MSFLPRDVQSGPNHTCLAAGPDLVESTQGSTSRQDKSDVKATRKKTSQLNPSQFVRGKDC